MAIVDDLHEIAPLAGREAIFQPKISLRRSAIRHSVARFFEQR
jgi:hypothetical protein